MKRHNVVVTLAGAGILALAAGAAAHPPRLSVLTQLVAVAGNFLSTLWQVIRVHVAQMTTAQLMQAAIGAWLIFVALLVLLARSKPKGPSPTDSPSEPARGVTVPERGSASTRDTPAPERESVSQSPLGQDAPQTVMQPIPLRAPPDDEPASADDLSDLANPPPWESTTLPAVPTPMQPIPLRPLPFRPLASPDDPSDTVPSSPPVPTTPLHEEPIPMAMQQFDGEEQPAHVVWSSHNDTPPPIPGHMVALTGVIEARDRLVSYGLFVVAEDAGVPMSANGASGANGANGASQRTVNTVVEHLTPLLTGTLAVGRAQRADLLQLAVEHALIALREEHVRTAQDLGVALTAALVIDNIAQFASIGPCRTYLFRPSFGLTQITTHRPATPNVSGDREGRPLDHELLPTYEPPEPVGTQRSSGRLPSEVDASEVDTQADDLLLLTSSKIWQSVDQAQVEAILHAAPNARNAARSLAREVASQPQGPDFSVVVVRPREGWMPGFGIAVARPGTQ